jgi:hypothetical protein
LYITLSAVRGEAKHLWIFFLTTAQSTKIVMVALTNSAYEAFPAGRFFIRDLTGLDNYFLSSLIICMRSLDEIIDVIT